MNAQNIQLENIQYVYFIGIGGIGMSALARWFAYNQKMVAGYDRTQTPLTQNLENEGIKIHFQDNVDKIPKEIREFPDETLIVITPAVPASHSELLFFQRNGYTIMKRAAVLGLLTHSLKTVAVAGTHGKTTTSTMVAHLLKEGGINCTAFLGGISANFNSNLLVNDINNTDELWAVVEADEFDRSFLHILADIAVVTSTDADHLDIYGEKEELEKSFGNFVSQINDNGTLFAQKNIAESVKNSIDKINENIQLINYNASNNYEDNNDGKTPIYATNIKLDEDQKNSCRFDFIDMTQEIPERINGLQLFMPGFHNVENMCAAIAVARKLGVSDDKIRSAVASFKGVKRRFEYIFRSEKVTYIDDYAHHPTEISALLSSIKHLYPNKKITAIFQPHLFSRTKDFQEEFAQSLSLENENDELILLNIYPARELPIEGITSDIILQQSKTQNKILLPDSELLSYIENKINNNEIEILLTLGAGNIDRFVNSIFDFLSKKTALKF
ncbi:UDP-N-acetylmuramate--L-alanine ligase [Bernardetia litoralis DSM 6794]|uniref:UDP-N-acetylmuramate--L-alanine ligase n=1 Tax=Bernardetia litoralis (strain ATCC 23117 / DSM 6794 / NBRC 15988 / NCIMB 1366 / Fx l1 / Sio-4) TaxID=880071 RepID=I4AHN0_BERLS|nr:UDP-N-acetylmuramate--L-alanine ligase [Bernardetia litoralis]AFM03465.1 UDP-N-acetylmuramate--L-alanine ligase [Bernardetia litoralis DSM 6794]